MSTAEHYMLAVTFSIVLACAFVKLVAAILEDLGRD